MPTTSFSVQPANMLNNAVVMYQSKFDPKKFTDLNTLYENYKMDSFVTYKGLLSLWNQRSIINTPLLNMTELQNNVMYIGNTEGRFRYSIPYDTGCPYVVENLEKDNVKPGKDGHRFQIKLSENTFTNSDIISVDMRDGIQLFITEDEIYEEDGGWVYTVEIVGSNRRNMYYPQAWMQPGMQYIKIQNMNDEYDTNKSSITTRGGIMDLEMELGSGNRSVTHWITQYADMCKIDESKHPQLARLNQMIGQNNAVTLYANLDKNGRPIPGTMTWHHTIELLLRAEIEKMTETGLMWAQGGYVGGGNGRRKGKVAAGLYPQLRNGNRITYNRISLELIEQNVANLFMNSGIPVEQRRTKIVTGQGGLNQISKELYDRMKNINPGLTQTKDFPGGFFYGDVANAGFIAPRFTKFFSPVAGYIEFEHNPALDNVYGLREQDGLIGDYPINSYTYMILDVTDQNVTNAAARTNAKYRVDNGFNESSNIVLVRPQDYGDIYWGYINGTHHPFGPSAMKGMFSANDYNGYQIWMKSWAWVWVKDVTRTLLMEKARPNMYL